MTKKDFEAAARLVSQIARNRWTNSPPVWADHNRMSLGPDDDVQAYTRAVQTAEVFVVLFTDASPTFQRDRFLIACGLVPTSKQGTL